MVTLEQLTKIYQFAPLKRLEKFIQPLNQAMQEFEINTPQRMRMFLAQIGHESGELRYVRELASGEAYENRIDLGNTEPGDGVRYKGRGLIQLTGRHNYAEVSKALDVPALSNPELLETPLLAARSAGWFWNKHNLNALADLGKFDAITRRINGGLNGKKDRDRLYALACKVIS
jgi:putative chitinase